MPLISSLNKILNFKISRTAKIRVRGSDIYNSRYLSSLVTKQGHPNTILDVHTNLANNSRHLILKIKANIFCYKKVGPTHSNYHPHNFLM